MSAVSKDAKKEPQMVIERHETVYMEVSISDFDDDALIAELASRNLHPEIPKTVSLEEMFLALQWGNNAKALALLREYLINETGRILP